MYDLTKVVLLLVCHKLYGVESYEDIPPNGHADGWGWTSVNIIDSEGNPFNGEIKGESHLCYPWYRYKALVKGGQVYKLIEFDKVI